MFIFQLLDFESKRAVAQAQISLFIQNEGSNLWQWSVSQSQYNAGETTEEIAAQFRVMAPFFPGFRKHLASRRIDILNQKIRCAEHNLTFGGMLNVPGWGWVA
jgi:hypothetical protein